jgi:Transketolase, pyrimidine binding domain
MRSALHPATIATCGHQCSYDAAQLGRRKGSYAFGAPDGPPYGAAAAAASGEIEPAGGRRGGRGALVIIGSPIFPVDPKGIAGRDASGRVLNVLAQNVPWLLGGSADLGPSNKTTLTFEGAGAFEPGTPGGRNLHFGVREHAMAAVVNGLSLSKLRAFA